MLLFFGLFTIVSALYEDQIFKLDWKQSFVGHVTHAGFHSTPKASVLVVATESHVIAGLDSDSGALLWRHAQEKDSLGQVLDLIISGRHSVSVSGEATFLFLRLWDSVTGALVQEHLVRPSRTPDMVSVQTGHLVLVYLDGTELELVTHSYDTKKLGDGVRRVMESPFPATLLGQGVKCVVSKDMMLVCSSTSSVYLLDLGSSSSSWERKDLGETILELQVKDTSLDVQTVTGLARLNTGTGVLEVLEKSQGVKRSGGCAGVMVTQDCEVEGMNSAGGKYCKIYNKTLKVDSKDGSVQHTLTEDRGKVESAWAGCEDGGWQLVLAMEDGALLSLTPRGNLMFLREEGLADISLVQMVAVGQAEKYSQQPAYHGAVLDPAMLLQNFLARIKRHVSQLQGLVLAITDFRLSSSAKDSVIVSDKFGLRKVVVVVTTRGKIYGLDSGSGAILWQTRVPGKPTALHLQRDGRQDSGAALASIVYKHQRSTHFILSFNPISGSVSTHSPISMDLDQALLLPETSDSDLRPLLLVGKDASASVFPSSSVSHIRALPKLFVVTSREGEGLTGNLVTVTSHGSVQLTPLWTLDTPGTNVLHVRTRQMEEKVHSAGRVMDDRSVLFKYMNPNLALVLAEGQDTTSKSFITVQVVDLVTGRIFFSATHKKVAPPFHAVLSENWAVYTYFNDKARRTELVSLELYEGKTQGNTTMFSSIENSVVPLVERQAYILPVSDVAALKETMTEKGITAKHLLVATTQGSVLDLPLHMVDPRRPALDTPPHLREPGIPPYIPELPVPHESILNYNQSVVGVRDITASPSGLESTVLLFIHGLDLYGTRIAPSKGFDLIKDDFEHIMIAGVLLFLVIASFVTRKLAQRKMLNQAWK